MLKLKEMQKVIYVIRPAKDNDLLQIGELDREAFPSESLFRSYTSYKRDLNSLLAHYIVAATEKDVIAINRSSECSQEEMKQSLRLYPQDTLKSPWLKRLFSHTHMIPLRAGRINLPNKEYVLGFASLWFMLNEAHIIAIAVRNNYRRMGIGEGLLISIIELATQLNANLVTLEVRASNEVAQMLYKKYGFQVVGRRLSYYSDNGEDALLMNSDTIISAPFQRHLEQLKKTHIQRWKGTPTITMA